MQTSANYLPDIPFLTGSFCFFFSSITPNHWSFHLSSAWLFSALFFWILNTGIETILLITSLSLKYLLIFPLFFLFWTQMSYLASYYLFIDISAFCWCPLSVTHTFITNLFFSSEISVPSILSYYSIPFMVTKYVTVLKLNIKYRNAATMENFKSWLHKHKYKNQLSDGIHFNLVCFTNRLSKIKLLSGFKSTS